MAEYVLTDGRTQFATDLLTEAEAGSKLSLPAEPEALTAEDGGTVDETYGADEADVIANLVTRVGELEAALIALGLLAEPA